MTPEHWKLKLLEYDMFFIFIFLFSFNPHFSASFPCFQKCLVQEIDCGSCLCPYQPKLGFYRSKEIKFCTRESKK